MRFLHRLEPRALVGRLHAAADAPWALRLRRLPLVGAVVHALSRRLAPPGRREWVRVQAGPARGLSLLLELRYDAGYWLGTVEPELQELLPRLVPSGGVAWDVGADVGFFTLLLARRVGPSGHVVAFEPDGERRAALEAAVAANGLENVSIRPVAVWSKAGRVGFEPRAESGEGFHGAVVAGAEMTVEATTLDDEWRGAPPDLVKIDVEGAEVRVLEGARRLLAEGRPTVVCEVHAARRGSAELPSLVRALLEEAGYDLRELDPGRSPAHLLAVPRPSVG